MMFLGFSHVQKPKRTSHNTIRGGVRLWPHGFQHRACWRRIRGILRLARLSIATRMSTPDLPPSSDQRKPSEACAERQRCWIKRKDAPADHTSWRPAKKHRVDAKHWAQALGNAPRVSTPTPALVHFLRPEDPEQTPSTGNWSGWRMYPHLSLAIDQGSDGLSGSSYLRSLPFNLRFWWISPMGGGHNDFFCNLKSLHLFSLWLLLLAPLNVEHGPFNDDVRFNQCREAWSDAVRHFAPGAMPIFAEKSKDMVAEAGGESALLE